MKLPSDIEALVQNEAIRKSRLGEHWLYAAEDVVAHLTGRPDAAEHWEDLKRWNPSLRSAARSVQVRNEPTDNQDGEAQPSHWQDVEMLTLEQVFRLVQAIDSPRAERLKRWLAESGQQRLEELADPELAIKRARTAYDRQGYSRDWINKRLRGVSARHELTGQWYKRGASESEQFRQLTNELMQHSFGMDVEQFRRHKHLGPENLRDHMNDLELALTTLSETTAAYLHKTRDSVGFEDLQRDVRDAGDVTAKARLEVEARLGHPITTPANHTRPLFKRAPRLSA